LTAVTVIVDVVDWPVLAAGGEVADTVKPVIWKTMLDVERCRDPVVPLTVTV
jgi:hypothetical protein